MWVSESSRSPTNRWPLKIVRPVSGKAGQAMVKSAPSASRSASATGPILPCVGAVEGRAVLEQVLPRPLPRQPALRRQRLRHRLRDRGRARLQRHHHGVGFRHRQTRLGHADQLHRAHAVAHQHAAQIGGAGEVVGDGAEQDRHGVSPASDAGLERAPHDASIRARSSPDQRQPRRADPLGPHAGHLVGELDVLDQLLVHIEMQQRHEPAIERPRLLDPAGAGQLEQAHALGREAVDQARDPARRHRTARSRRSGRRRRRTSGSGRPARSSCRSCAGCRARNSLIATMLADSARPRKPSGLRSTL